MLTEASIRQAFARRIEPIQTTAGYRAAAIAVGLAVVLLPVLYLALVVGAAWGCWWYATVAMPAVIANVRNGKVLVLAATPLVAGVAMVIFLLKPLVAAGSGASRRAAPAPEALARLFDESRKERKELDAAAAHVQAAGDAAVTTGERYYEAEVHRLHGELLAERLSGKAAEAEGNLKGALEIARKQGSRTLELRAAVALSRFWRTRGRLTEAAQLLSSIYG